MASRVALWRFAACLVLGVFTQCNQKGQKFQQYYAEGERLYVKHCSNCHQRSGKGLMLVYPPVDVSDYIDGNFDDVICLMKYGRKGEMKINGNIFNQPMPGVRSLTPLELAEISTYLLNNWGRNRGIVEVSAVSRIVDKCTY